MYISPTETEQQVRFLLQTIGQERPTGTESTRQASQMLLFKSNIFDTKMLLKIYVSPR